MTSLATSGRHLSKFEKTCENAASDGFGSSFSRAAFCLPIGGGASCLTKWGGGDEHTSPVLQRPQLIPFFLPNLPKFRI